MRLLEIDYISDPYAIVYLNWISLFTHEDSTGKKGSMVYNGREARGGN